MLNKKVEAYKRDKTTISTNTLINQLPQLKSEFEFLKDAPAQALQQSILNLNSAFVNFFKNGSGFPKFKKKGTKDSFRNQSLVL